MSLGLPHFHIYSIYAGETTMFSNESMHDILHLQLKLNERSNKDNISIALAMVKITHAIYIEKKLMKD